MENTTQHEVSTKPEAGAESTDTNLTLDWSDLTNEEIIEIAARAEIVKLQNGWRKNGIPAGNVTIKVTKPGVRAPRGPVDVAALLAKLDPAEREKVLAKYLAG